MGSGLTRYDPASFTPGGFRLDITLLVKAAIMGIVEGLTEFLPISSTGHLILAASLLDFTGSKIKVFEIAIQTGAMFAVIWEYRVKLGSTVRGITHDAVAQRFALNLLIAFIPAVVLGLAFNAPIKEHLFHPVPVAMAFVVGAFIILWVERRHHRRYGELDLAGGRHARVETVDDMSALDALKVGLVQCAALIPGTSRSGATIIGAMVFGVSRKAATEFSFFLGIPTLMGAGVYSVLKNHELLSMDDLPVFAVGLVFAFFSALLCIRWLIRYVSTHDFVPFAWYRIVFGGLVLLTAWSGWVEWRA
ncbi:undecaprenyl-diphosphatase [Burkholderiaceae bacterium]|nr:undecaprenyl-diphosphatase [Burkholderiaceae bacterium]